MLTATDCTFSGSQVTTTGEFGGNFYIAGGELKLNTGSPVVDDGAAANGGNIYVYGAASALCDGVYFNGMYHYVERHVYKKGRFD